MSLAVDSDVGRAVDREVPNTPCAVLLLADIKPANRLWGYARFVLGGRPLRHVAGLRLSKVLGSGFEGGFGLRPSTSRQGLFCLFDNAIDANVFATQSALVQAYRERADEFLVAQLEPYASRGSWSGQTLHGSGQAPDGVMAALTRASIRPAAAHRFWRHAGPSQRDLGSARGCLLAVGLGEAPLLRQATFSVWQSAGDMNAYARSGAHQTAIRAAQELGFFSESMFTRFRVRSLLGDWRGSSFG